MSTSSTNDKTVNKVALCSAIFAGFAYVGYSVVRTAFGKKGKHDTDGRVDEHRLYFRRLSQTTQTDVLLGNLDVSGSGKVMLRSITVQERIRELNLRARMFTDTMLAIQTAGNTPSHYRVATKSLQGSPWSSPRILSPVDVQHVLSSRSSENLHLFGADLEFNTSSPVKRRWTRRSLCKKSQPRSKSRNVSVERQNYENVSQKATKFLENNEDELKTRLNSLSETSGRVVTSFEANSIVTLLYSKDDDVLRKAIVTIGNFSSFTENQNTFREAGCLYKLSTLVTHPDTTIKLSALSTLANLTLNQENQKEIKNIIPLIVLMLKSDSISDELITAILVLLTNVAVLPDYHDMFYPVLHTAYQIVDNGSPANKLQALKLLINLSCNEDMVPSLLAAQAPRRLIYFLNDSTNEDILLRVVTLLSNLTRVAKMLAIDPTVDLPTEDKAASPETMYAAIFGINTQEKMKLKVFGLMNHKNEDIRSHCKKIYEDLP